MVIHHYLHRLTAGIGAYSFFRRHPATSDALVTDPLEELSQRIEGQRRSAKGSLWTKPTAAPGTAR